MAVRALGPSLPIAGKLSDPTLDLRDGSGSIMQNDNWRSTQPDALIAAGLAPVDDRECAVIARLNPGSYTAIVRGVNNATGIGLVEIFDQDQ